MPWYEEFRTCSMYCMFQMYHREVQIRHIMYKVHVSVSVRVRLDWTGRVCVCVES